VASAEGLRPPALVAGFWCGAPPVRPGKGRREGVWGEAKRVVQAVMDVGGSRQPQGSAPLRLERVCDR